jgi:hypothetical protein
MQMCFDIDGMICFRVIELIRKHKNILQLPIL